MATSTFERKIEMEDLKSLKKLIDVMDADASVMPFSQYPFSDVERDRSEQLLKQCSSRSKYELS